MTKSKVMAVLLATVMVVVALGSIVQVTDDASATGDVQAQDTVNVYFHNGTSWTDDSYEVFNAFEAVQEAAQSGLGFGIVTDPSNSQWYVEDDENGTNPNMTYGVIRDVIRTSDRVTADSFAIMAYDPSDSVWVDVTDYSLGLIRPFMDYAAYVEAPQGSSMSLFASANVAIIFDDDVQITMPSVGLRGLTNPVERSDCLYSFLIVDTVGDIMSGSSACYGKQYVDGVLTLRNLNKSDFANGVTIYGYGSDAYLALMDATGGMVQGMLNGQQELSKLNVEQYYSYYTYYSWMDSLFGAGTVTISGDDSTTYKYWASYDSDLEYLNFTLGYYTTIPGYYTDPINAEVGNASMNINAFTLMYMELEY